MVLGGEWYLDNHIRANQLACAKSTIHLCGIYTGTPSSVGTVNMTLLNSVIIRVCMGM